MKKRSVIIVAVAAAVIGISAVAYAGSVTAFSENVNLLSTQSGYPCPGACLTWTGSTGGGIDCLCHRYVGRCKSWRDGNDSSDNPGHQQGGLEGDLKPEKP